MAACICSMFDISKVQSNQTLYFFVVINRLLAFLFHSSPVEILSKAVAKKKKKTDIHTPEYRLSIQYLCNAMWNSATVQVISWKLCFEILQSKHQAIKQKNRPELHFCAGVIQKIFKLNAAHKESYREFDAILTTTTKSALKKK